MAQRLVSSNKLTRYALEQISTVIAIKRRVNLLNGLLKSTDGGRLEAQVRLEVLGDLTDQTLEGELSDEELGRLLVTTDLTESDSSWLVSVGLLDTSGRWCRLAGSLGSKLLTRSLATGGL